MLMSSHIILNYIMVGLALALALPITVCKVQVYLETYGETNHTLAEYATLSQFL